MNHHRSNQAAPCPNFIQYCFDSDIRKMYVMSSWHINIESKYVMVKLILQKLCKRQALGKKQCRNMARCTACVTCVHCCTLIRYYETPVIIFLIFVDNAPSTGSRLVLTSRNANNHAQQKKIAQQGSIFEYSTGSGIHPTDRIFFIHRETGSRFSWTERDCQDILEANAACVCPRQTRL